ncbi:hypothetical protein MNBD_CHLOROFLEXI01-4638, partial [hydrothermal vent metagenome]
MKTGGNLVQILPPGINPGEAGEQLYSFNQRNLLTQYQVGAGSSVYNTLAEYSYDGGSNRLQQIDSSGTTPTTTTYTNDNVALSQVLVSNDGTTTTYNLFGLDLIQQDDGSQTRTLLVDGLGSARVEMVGNTIENTTTYEPYGKLLTQTGSSGTTYGYTGEQYDTAASLVYLRARYYNPNLKVFMSRDPFKGSAKLPASQHPYSYVHNNPNRYIDPSGHDLVTLNADPDELDIWAQAIDIITTTIEDDQISVLEFLTEQALLIGGGAVASGVTTAVISELLVSAGVIAAGAV